MVSMTTYCHADVLDMYQWYAAHARCNWRPFYLPRMVTSELLSRRDSYDDRLFPISPQTIPTMVSAETQLYKTKAQPNYVSNHTEMTITIPNPNCNAEIQVTLLPSQDGNRQSIWWWSRRRSNEFSKREIAVSTRSSHTDKSKPTESQSTETRTEKSTKKFTKKSTKIPLKPPIESVTMKSNGRSPKRTANNDYPVNATYQWQPTERYSTEHCTKARESANALELVKYNHFREAYVLDVDEWDATTHDAIDVYN